MKVQEILRALVAIPTPSSVSNLPLIDWASRFVSSKGWAVEQLHYADENGITKSNLIARPVQNNRLKPIDLAFVCHTDTVPYASNWSSALDLKRNTDGTFLHGCGACDVKGALACFLAALATEAPQKEVALLLTADEEIGCKGIERMLADTALQIRSALVSEPTSLRPGIAGKGYGLARVRVEGVEAHSAFPREGLSAIQVAARFITRIEALMASRDRAADAPFDPPRTTLNVGVIEGGSAKNIVAGECSFLVEWRPIPADSPRAVLTELEQIADELGADEPRAQIHIELLRAEAGFIPGVRGPLQARLAAVLAQSRKPAGISFGSEATWLVRVADEVIVIGPGDMRTAHSDRECVSVAELDEWTTALHTLFYSN